MAKSVGGGGCVTRGFSGRVAGGMEDTFFDEQGVLDMFVDEVNN